MRHSQLSEYLGLSKSDLFTHLIEWASQFNFKINGDFINMEDGDVDAFLRDLENNFKEWDAKERKKSDKL